ncbi:MAG: type II toxin-antitoxin system death-on-curing family toxin [Patescibacteria group bacterium]
MYYIPRTEFLIIHARIIDVTGGAHGVRDIPRLLSAVERPKMQFSGKDLYPTVFDKAAVYFESIAFDHPFIDGNKRTAIAMTARFLFLNGYELKTTNKLLEQFVINAVVEKYTLDIIAKWLKRYSKLTKQIRTSSSC